jgi:type I restriction enzyme, R subunit
MVTTESKIESDLIAKLTELKYEYRDDIRDRFGLERNFREKFQALNRVQLSDTEFQRLLEQIITPDVFAASHSLREYSSFLRDDGTPLNFTLVNIKDWCKNSFEVINQLRINTDNSHHRYDVILLINGVPVVQLELKTLQVSPRRAMQQIVEYKNEPGNGYGRTLLSFIQLFIVSNYSDTWYFANNNTKHFSFNADERFLPIYQYAAEDNRKIVNLDAFAEKFLAKCTLGQMISRYMVRVASEQKLMVMRPYQIYAVKALVDCIQQNVGNGYVWHTTGSGKTLTSFKASTLLKDNPDIEKCLFVVDRKDLDRQTREEFNRFQEGCVEENTNTETLVRRLLSDDYADKVIVTTTRSWGWRSMAHTRRITRRGWSRSATSGWPLFLTNATARSLVRTTRRSRSSSRKLSFSASPERRFSRRMPVMSRLRAKRRAIAQRKPSSSDPCTNIRSLTPLKTVMSFASISIITRPTATSCPNRARG